MTRKREEQVSLDDTPFYHCMVRCVRRAFLFGEDESGRNFDHRKAWIVKRFKQLASVFAIDVCAYAVMSNHYHLVLCVDQEKAKVWTDCEVVERWLLLFKGDLLIERWLANGLTEAEEIKVQEIIDDWRQRLMNISWFMRCMNESIARQANAEDGCKGRFWEGRFKSQALLDEQALLSCMVYVDLNPIRAGLADSPETSDFTSIQERIHEFSRRRRTKSARVKSPMNKKITRSRSTMPKVLNRYATHSPLPEAPLKALDGNDSDETLAAIPFACQDYFALVDWTGRAIREEKGKGGAIANHLPPILQRLGVERKNWFRETQYFESRFKQFAGSMDALETKAKQLKQTWLHGMGGYAERLRQRDKGGVITT